MTCVPYSENIGESDDVSNLSQTIENRQKVVRSCRSFGKVNNCNIEDVGPKPSTPFFKKILFLKDIYRKKERKREADRERGRGGKKKEREKKKERKKERERERERERVGGDKVRIA